MYVFFVDTCMRVQIAIQTKRNMSIRFKSFGAPNWRVLYFAKSKINNLNAGYKYTPDYVTVLHYVCILPPNGRALHTPRAPNLGTSFDA